MLVLCYIIPLSFLKPLTLSAFLYIESLPSQHPSIFLSIDIHSFLPKSLQQCPFLSLLSITGSQPDPQNRNCGCVSAMFVNLSHTSMAGYVKKRSAKVT